jgi:hypothetical protein
MASIAQEDRSRRLTMPRQVSFSGRTRRGEFLELSEDAVELGGEVGVLERGCLDVGVQLISRRLQLIVALVARASMLLSSSIHAVL